MNWWYLDGEEQKGPIQEEELKLLLEKGGISRSTLVWQESMTDWLPAAEVKAFQVSSSEKEISPLVKPPVSESVEKESPVSVESPQAEKSAQSLFESQPEMQSPVQIVSERKGFPLRWAILGGLVLLGLASLFIFQKKEVEDTEAIREVSADAVAWTNAVTGREVEFSNAWKITKEKAEGEQLEVFHFRDKAGKMQLDLGGERLPQLSIEEYVTRYKESMKSEMNLEIAGKVYMEKGYLHWEGGGVMAKDANQRVKIHILKMGDDFWRAVRIQSPPFEESDKALEELEAKLWSSFEGS